MIFIKLFLIAIIIPLHELAHGYTAYLLGDDTAQRSGRLSLNPIIHIDLVGAAMLFFAGFGWAKPIPVNPYNFRNMKTDMAITAAAGPIANFIIAVFLALIFSLLQKNLLQTQTNYLILRSIYVAIELNVALGIFNLIPIPPLDGSKILGAFLSDKAYYNYTFNERKGSGIIIAIFAIGYFTNLNILGWIIYPPIKLVMNILVG